MKTANKIFAILLSLIALTFVMSLSVFAEEGSTTPTPTVYEVATEGEFNTANNKAVAGDIIRFTADISCSSITVQKAITIDLGGKTLTTSSTFSGVILGGGASMINGTILHTGKTSAMKAYNVDKLEDLIIKIESEAANTGGISTRSASDAKGNAHINVIRNVKMIGTGNYGIETYGQGDGVDKTKPVIDLMENVEIDSITYGLNLTCSIGLIKDCIISGSQAGIYTKNANGYTIAIEFEGDNEIMGEDCAVLVETNSSITLTADKYTRFINTNGNTVFSMNENSASESTFSIVGYTIDGNQFVECDHELVGGSCTERAECSKCGISEYKHVNLVEDVSKRVEPDCTVQGKAYYTCECGVVKSMFIERNPNAHVWELKDEAEASCTEDGYKIYKCKYGSCVDAEQKETFTKLGHDIIVDTKGYPATCTTAGKTNAEHCSRCNDATTTQEDIPALGHDVIFTPAVPATCTQTGLTQGVRCSRCDALTSPQTETTALGHDMVTDPAVLATCTQTGLTAGEHCSRCNDATVAQEVAPALGHDMVVDPAVPATCTQTGLTAGEHCSRCNDVTVARIETPALGHDIVVDSVEVAPTCTKEGATKAEHCSRCADMTVVAVAIPVLDHTWTPATLEAPMTCTACGLTQGEKLPEEGLSTGAIVAIVIGSVAVVGAGGFSLFWFVIRKKFM